MPDVPLPPQRTCTACAQTDQDPMVVYGHPDPESPKRQFHFDCLPDDLAARLLAGAGDEADKLRQVIAHARADGVEHLHGHDLRVRHTELLGSDAAKAALGIKTTAKKG